MAVDEKMMKAADFAKVSSIDFVYTFNKNMKQLTELLGITRKIEKVPGQTARRSLCRSTRPRWRTSSSLR